MISALTHFSGQALPAMPVVSLVLDVSPQHVCDTLDRQQRVP